MTFWLENATATLRVNDLAESIKFYTELLGFKVDWGEDGGICGISRDNKGVMLTTLEGQGPSILWLGVDDIAPIYEHLKAHGVPCVLEPRNMMYAYETRFTDPSGNILWFGSGPLEDQPFG